MTRLLLWVRAAGGWGEHPDILRARYSTMLRLLPGLVFFMLVGGAFFPGGLILEGMSTHHMPSLVYLLRASSVPVAAVIALFGLALFQILSIGRLSRRGASSSLPSAYGRCFKVLAGPNLFARIGLTSETAHWYALPLEWDEVVEPGDAEYELTVKPGSGWVERVRRLGADPRELTQEPPVILTGAAARANAEEEWRLLREYLRGEATTEERQAFKRFARAQKLGWRASPLRIAVCGWMGVVIGIFTGPGIILYTVILLALAPHAPFLRYMAQFLIFFSVLAVIGIGMIVWGIHYLRAWRSLRSLRDEEPVEASGEIVAWVPYLDGWTPSTERSTKETLIQLRNADDTTHIFRIPAKYAHRVRERGEVVRVEYRPTTERVVTVHRLGQASSLAQASE